MKKGQAYIVTKSQARGVIRSVSPTRIGVQWTNLSSGRSTNSPKICDYSRKQVEHHVEQGKLIIGDPDSNPNAAFLMRKHNVHS